MANYSCPKGWLVTRDSDGNRIPFFIKTRGDDIVWGDIINTEYFEITLTPESTTETYGKVTATADKTLEEIMTAIDGGDLVCVKTSCFGYDFLLPLSSQEINGSNINFTFTNLTHSSLSTDTFTWINIIIEASTLTNTINTITVEFDKINTTYDVYNNHIDDNVKGYQMHLDTSELEEEFYLEGTDSSYLSQFIETNDISSFIVEKG